MSRPIAVLLLLAAIPGTAWAENVLSLGDADVKIFGAARKDFGSDGNVAGDINNDGFDDIVVGARLARGGGESKEGRAYLIYGGPRVPSRIDLGNPGPNVVTLITGEGNDQFGAAVSDAGDLNADGIDDFMVTAARPGDSRVFVIFGSPSLPSVLNVTTQGVEIHGQPYSDLGVSISRAGDFNGDGHDDIIVGATRSNRGHDSSGSGSGDDDDDDDDDWWHHGRRTGAAFIIFGGPDLPSRIDVTNLGTRGTAIWGIKGNDELGAAVGDAGDFNDDGITDVILGAPRASPDRRWLAGQAFIVFGSRTPAAEIHLGSLGSGGVTIKGDGKGENAGSSVACAGDFNDDGIADVIVGAEHARAKGVDDSGRAYIVFGSGTPSAEVDLRELGPGLLRLNGVGNGSHFGHSVHCIGDFDRDTIDDVIVGAHKQNVNGRYRAGRAYILSGTATPPLELDMARLGDAGIILNGESANDRAGHRVADAGDLNADGVPDVIVTAELASPFGRHCAGEYYVVFGPATPIPENLVCVHNLTETILSWTNPTSYDALRIDRDGETVATLPGDATSFVDPEPVVGVVTYEVFGVIGDAPSLPVACVVTIEVLPPFSISCQSVDGEVVINWVQRHPGPVDGTRIFRDGDLLAEVAGDVETFVDENAPPGEHSYELQAFVGFEESARVECFATVPIGPRNLACLADSCTVTLTWANLDEYTSIQIFRDGFPLPLVTLGGSLDTFSDQGVPAGSHSYEVEGLIGTDASARARCSVVVAGAVENLSATAVEGDVSLSWTLPPQAADEILIARDGVPLVSIAGTATSFDDLGLASGTYVYEIRLRVGPHLGKPASVTVDVVDPVRDLNGSIDGARAVLTWTLGDDYDAIEVSRDGAVIALLPGAAQSLIDPIPGPGTFVYQVVGLRGNGRSAPAETTEVAPIPPRDVGATLADSTLKLSWTNGQIYDSIQIRINGSIQAPISGIATTATFSGIGPLGSATVEVRGIVADNISEAAIFTAVVVDAPRDLICQADGTSVDLSWTNGGIYDAVRVKRDGTEIALLPGDATSLSDTVNGPGRYEYQVIGVIDGVDTFAAECNFEILAPPADLDCETDGDTVTLSWTTAQNHQSVVVERDGQVLAVVPGGIKSFTDAAPPTGILDYELRLVSQGNPGVGARCTIRILDPVTDLACLSSGLETMVSWTLNGPADAIVIFRNGLEITPPGGIDGNSTTFVDSPVSPGLYCYEVRTLTADGGVSPLSEPCCTEVLLRPVRLSCSAVDATASLNWVNPREYESIEILRDGLVIATLPGTALSFEDPEHPLDPGPHTWEVRGLSGGSVSDAASCTLDIPSGLASLDCRQEGTNIVLEFDAGEAAETILIVRNDELVATLPGAATRYVDPDLTVDVYTYEVRKGIGTAQSTPFTCVVEMARAPSGLTCNLEEATVTLTWSPGDNYDSIRVHRNGVLLTDPPLAGNATTLVDEDLPPGAYLYEVSGTRGANVSASSTCTVLIIPPVFNLTCRVHGNEGLLSWTDGATYDSIEISRKAPSQGQATLLTTVPGGATSFTDSPLLETGTYEYVVVGIQSGIRSRSAVCSTVRPRSPTQLSCVAENETINFGDVRLGWVNVDSYDSLDLFRNGVLVVELAGNATEYVDADLPSGQFSYDLVGVIDGSRSEPAQCDVTVALPPPPVTNFNCVLNLGGTVAALSWDALPSTFEETWIYRCGPGDDPATCADEPIVMLPNTPTSFNDPNVNAPGMYRYEIAGVRDGKPSTRAVCRLEKPETLMNLECKPANLGLTRGDVVLTWSNGDNYTSITIQRDGNAIAVLAGSATTYTDSGLEVDIEYEYALFAVKEGNHSERTSCRVTIPAHPPTPSGFDCVINDTRAELSWTNEAVYDEIIIRRRGPGQGLFAEVARLPGSAESYTEAASNPGLHEWEIRATIAEQISDPASCSAEKPARPVTVTCDEVTFTPEGTNIVVRWQNQSSAYDSIIIMRTRLTDKRGVPLPVAEVESTSLRGDQQSFRDLDIEDGAYDYVVVAVIGGSTSRSNPCHIEIFEPRFIRAECNLDGKINIADPIFLLSWVFRGGAGPRCLDACDANDDGRLDIADAVFQVHYLFRRGALPRAPFPFCGPDPTTEDDLGCLSPPDLCD